MVRNWRFATTAVLSAAGLGAPASGAQPAAPEAAVAPSPGARQPASALRADLDLLRRAITESHPGAYRYQSRETIDAAFDAAARRLTEPMNAIEFLRVIAPAVASLRDGHTSARLPEAASEAFRRDAPLLPLRLHLLDGRLYVLRDLGAEPAAARLAGREVIAINGRPAATIISDLNALLEGDGAITSSRVAALRTIRFNTLFALLYGATARYHVSLRGLARPVSLTGRPQAVLAAGWSGASSASAEPPAALNFSSGGAIATLTIRSFSGHADAARTQPLGAFIDAAFAEMASRASRALIIDLRGNGGGQDNLGLRLLSHLIARPFRYYRGLYLNGRDISFAAHVDRWPGPVPENVAMPDNQGRLQLIRHPNLGEHQPASPRFAGRVYILMDGGSFSTTAEFLSLAHFHRLATFIGEEAGGGYYGNTAGVVLTLSLPNSGIRIRLPMVRYELAVTGYAPADRGVRPDHHIEPTVADLIAGRDRAMELALSLAGRN